MDPTITGHLHQAITEYALHKESSPRRRLLEPASPETNQTSSGGDEEAKSTSPSTSSNNTEAKMEWVDQSVGPIIEYEEVGECYKTLKGLTNHFLSQSEMFMHVVRNSGKDYNDYGRYEDCMEKDDFKFYMATILQRFHIPMSIGLCLPKECTSGLRPRPLSPRGSRYSRQTCPQQHTATYLTWPNNY